ncbi:hypothetical protein C7M84_018226 [Penaeus vannamei]|uniref:Uncharacterized protein n=1 Tax=Penaeus vannamei TaxID=6689 RepID=A0A3R7PEX4_PENVA|nr:hypothetical protein C7M84_018226 [Penaeus vannamei]
MGCAATGGTASSAAVFPSCLPSSSHFSLDLSGYCYFGFSHGKIPPEKPDDSLPTLHLLRPEATPGRNGDEGGGAFQIKGDRTFFDGWLLGVVSLSTQGAPHTGEGDDSVDGPEQRPRRALSRARALLLSIAIGRYSRWPSLLFNLPHPRAPQEEGRGIAGGFFLSRRKGVHTRDLTPRYRRNVAEGRRTAGAQPSRGEGRKRGAALGNHSERQERGGRLCEGQDHSRHWRGWHGDWLPGGPGGPPTPELTKSTGRRPNPQKTPHTPGPNTTANRGPSCATPRERTPSARPTTHAPVSASLLAGGGRGATGPPPATLAGRPRGGPAPASPRSSPASTLGRGRRRAQATRPNQQPPAQGPRGPDGELDAGLAARPQPKALSHHDRAPGPALGRPPGKNGPFGGIPAGPRPSPTPPHGPRGRRGPKGESRASPCPRKTRQTDRQVQPPARPSAERRGTKGKGERKPKPKPGALPPAGVAPAPAAEAVPLSLSAQALSHHDRAQGPPLPVRPGQGPVGGAAGPRPNPTPPSAREGARGRWGLNGLAGQAAAPPARSGQAAARGNGPSGDARPPPPPHSRPRAALGSGGPRSQPRPAARPATRAPTASPYSWRRRPATNTTRDRAFHPSGRSGSLADARGDCPRGGAVVMWVAWGGGIMEGVTEPPLAPHPTVPLVLAGLLSRRGDVVNSTM